ncbi:type II secretion system protein [bacterium]|nr:type II secretion system protein [bacterium]
MKKFKIGFTLAEVLITLSIIGVVAAVTTPSLIMNYTKKTQAVAIKKFVTQLEDALTRYMADNRADTLMEAGFDTAAGRNDFFTNYFKIESNCGGDKASCFGSTYANINGTKKTFSESLNNWCSAAYTLKSGASFCISQANYMNGGSYIIDGKTHKLDYIYIDTNGKKGPNIAGRDYFLVYIFEDGSLDEQYATPECRNNANSANCRGKATLKAARTADNCIGNADVWPAGCLGRLLENNWKMNY